MGAALVPRPLPGATERAEGAAAGLPPRRRRAPPPSRSRRRLPPAAAAPPLTPAALSSLPRSSHLAPARLGQGADTWGRKLTSFGHWSSGFLGTWGRGLGTWGTGLGKGAGRNPDAKRARIRWDRYLWRNGPRAAGLGLTTTTTMRTTTATATATATPKQPSTFGQDSALWYFQGTCGQMPGIALLDLFFSFAVKCRTTSPDFFPWAKLGHG